MAITISPSACRVAMAAGGGAVTLQGTIALQPPNWSPDRRRRIPLWDAAGLAPPPRRPAVTPSRWPDKPAAAMLDYSIDAEALLAGSDDMLTMGVSSTATLTLAASAIAGGDAVLWLAGGQPGMDNPVCLTLRTVSGRIVNRTIRLMVT